MKSMQPKVLTLQDVITETALPIYIPVAGMDGGLQYIRPTDEDVKLAREKATEEIKIERERDRMLCSDGKGGVAIGAKPISEQMFKRMEDEKFADLCMYAGLHKADKSITPEMFKKLPPEVKTQIQLYLTNLSFKGVMTKEEVENLKNLRELTKD